MVGGKQTIISRFFVIDLQYDLWIGSLKNILPEVNLFNAFLHLALTHRSAVDPLNIVVYVTFRSTVVKTALSRSGTYLYIYMYVSAPIHFLIFTSSKYNFLNFLLIV